MDRDEYSDGPFPPIQHRLGLLYPQLQGSHFSPFPTVQELHLTLLTKLKQHLQLVNLKPTLTPQNAPHEIQLHSSRFQLHIQRLHDLLATLPIPPPLSTSLQSTDPSLATWRLIDSLEHYQLAKLTTPSDSTPLPSCFAHIVSFIETNHYHDNFEIVFDALMLVLHATACGANVRVLHKDALPSIYKQHNQQQVQNSAQEQPQTPANTQTDAPTMAAAAVAPKPAGISFGLGKKLNIGPGSLAKPVIAAQLKKKTSGWGDSDSESDTTSKPAPTNPPSIIAPTLATGKSVDADKVEKDDNNKNNNNNNNNTAEPVLNPILLNSSPSGRAAVFLPLLHLLITQYFLPNIYLPKDDEISAQFFSMLHDPVISSLIFPQLSLFAMTHIYHKYSTKQSEPSIQPPKTSPRFNSPIHLSHLSTFIALFTFLLTDVCFTSFIFMLCQWDRLLQITHRIPSSTLPRSTPTALPPQLTSANISSLFSTLLLTQLFISNSLYKPSTTTPSILSEHAHFLYHSTQPHNLPDFLIDPQSTGSGLLSSQNNALETLLQCYTTHTTCTPLPTPTPHPKLSQYQRLVQASEIDKAKAIKKYPPQFDPKELATHSDIDYLKKHFPQALILRQPTTPPPKKLRYPKDPKNAQMAEDPTQYEIDMSYPTIHNTGQFLLDPDNQPHLDIILTSCPQHIFISLFSTILPPNHIHELFSVLSNNFTIPPSPAIKLYHKQFNLKTSSLSHPSIQYPNQSIAFLSSLYICDFLQSHPNRGYYTPHNPQYLPETTSTQSLQDQIINSLEYIGYSGNPPHASTTSQSHFTQQQQQQQQQQNELLFQQVPPDVVQQDIAALIADLDMITELTQMELDIEH